MPETIHTDLVIVGAGPAGMTAALYGARALLRTVVLERGECGGELLNTDKIENFISYPSVLGRDLAVRFKEHAIAAGAEVREFTPVESVRRRDDGMFETTLESGAEVYVSPAVIVTAGGTPVKLGIPGELEYAGRGVSYCAVCDANFFKGVHILVVGGGDAAVEEAGYLSAYGSHVTLIHRRDELRASKVLQKRLFENPKISVVWNAVAEEVLGNADGDMIGLRVRDVVSGEQRTIDGEGLFVFIGFRPNTGVIDGHVDHDEQGYILTDTSMMSSMPGLFVAGDMRAQLTRQITTAAGDGTTAAIAAEKYIKAIEDAKAHGASTDSATSEAVELAQAQAGGYAR